eukprot:Skav204268  [mRNA]  locus=scaffold912:286103:288004:- [translate_table: standard]
MVALGGGVVGDLVGFTAATYMRGVPVVQAGWEQVPTSTMAMIDSSVGGKTALNVPAGKNLIGAFHQPKAEMEGGSVGLDSESSVIFADPQVLGTLSRREVVEGLAEAIKMGVIRDAQLFQDGAVLHKAVKHKADIVAIDEKETGLRATLSLGSAGML